MRICFLSALLLMCGAQLVVSQTTTSSRAPTETSTKAPLRADENFELKIDERRITRENFEASTAVGTSDSQHLYLQIGVGLAAGKIEALLRNVRGSVRFHGTLERILELLENRSPTTPR